MSGGPQTLKFEVAGRDAFANTAPLAPEDVSLACSPAHTLTDISIAPNSSPSLVAVSATVACTGATPQHVEQMTQIDLLRLLIMVRASSHCSM